MALHKKIGLRQVKACWFGSLNWFRPSTFAEHAEVSKRNGKAVKPAVDLLYSLIALGELVQYPIYLHSKF